MAASSSASAVANPNNKSYQVFINHRGVDVKVTFARSFYLRLFDKGLTAFLDQEEMQHGYQISSQIEQAIRSASIHVAIFSPRYAESDWCLNELLLMLKSNAPIIPVFYRVKPAEVRWMLGSYGEALQTHERKGRYDPNTLEKWRNALHQVASNSGFELETCNGEELVLELLDKVVKRLSEMVIKPDLYVAEYPTGLDYKLKDFEDTVLLLQQQSTKPQILGIVGLGGVGKTTMAKEFFNRKKSGYNRSCFLSEVRDHAATRSLNLLQSQLLQSLIGVDKQENINSVDEGKGMLMEPLKTYNALIILDDVDDVNQVKALLPVQTDDLCSGSLILITSRDKGVLRSSKVEKSSIYGLSGLNEQHSLELFCSHAFSQTYPLPGFKCLVDKFLDCCNGLPLSLKVFGALLYDKEISEWEDELESLQQILPSEIHKTFIISYRSLNEEEKEIFLDIACFFINQNRDAAISIWNGSGWRGKRGFLNLQDKSLVEVDSWNFIHMHDHLRDLGRHVAASSSPCRLWRSGTKNVIDNLSYQEITVRGIRMVHGEYSGHAKDDLFGDIDTDNSVLEGILRRLQILHIEGSLFEPILRKVKLPNLLWLQWEKCPHSSMPSWVPMKNLRVLQVFHSELNIIGHTEGEPQLPVSLEDLQAYGCKKLKSIRALAQATKLRSLAVSWCTELEELPSLETLVSLEELRADGCLKLKSIRGSSQVPKLRYLDVSGCSELEELPSMEKLVSLEELRVKRCWKLKSIRGSAQATKLRSLDVSRCSGLEELPSMETLISLEKLVADRCEKLKSIRGLAHATKLRSLDVSWCSELEELQIMGTLVSLEELQAEGCEKLNSIRGWVQATKLRSLDVSHCSELEELPNLETLVSLEELRAKGCEKLKRIMGLAQATKLRSLDVSWCSGLEELSSMETLVSLEKLAANRCEKLKSVRGMAQATKLRALDVSWCSELEELPSMEKLVSLEDLRASGCVKLKSIRGLAQATKLRYLVISGCSGLEELPSMETLVSLEELWAFGLVKLKSIRGLGQATKLRHLIVCRCFELEELPSMETLVSLEDLKVDECVKLKSIRGLAQATKLRKLSARSCFELEEIEGVEHCKWLKMLDISGCPKLQYPSISEYQVRELSSAEDERK